MVWVCCPACANCQESRELKVRTAISTRTLIEWTLPPTKSRVAARVQCRQIKDAVEFKSAKMAVAESQSDAAA